MITVAGDDALKITWINADISRKNIDTFDNIILLFEDAKRRDENLEWKKNKFTYEVIP